MPKSLGYFTPENLALPPHHNRPDPDPHPSGTPRLSADVPERLLIRVWRNVLVVGCLTADPLILPIWQV